jgi:hypothetical protein
MGIRKIKVLNFIKDVNDIFRNSGLYGIRGMLIIGVGIAIHEFSKEMGYESPHPI